MMSEQMKEKLFSYRMLLKKNAPEIFNNFKKRKLEAGKKTDITVQLQSNIEEENGQPT